MAAGYPYRRILVPVDFSEVSVGAVRHALVLTRPGGASVVRSAPCLVLILPPADAGSETG